MKRAGILALIWEKNNEDEEFTATILQPHHDESTYLVLVPAESPDRGLGVNQEDVKICK